MKDYSQVEVTSRTQWRRWLAAHHTQAMPIWLVTWKKGSGDNHVAYADVVEEALCFGWIDSLPRRLDEAQSMLLLAPRKAGSTWSAANRERAERLIASGDMTAAGQAKIDRAKADGSWRALARAETGRAPPDLAKALKAAGAMEDWRAFSLAVRKRLIEHIEGAKRPDTRTARIGKIVEGARLGHDPLDWRAAQGQRRRKPPLNAPAAHFCRVQFDAKQELP